MIGNTAPASHAFAITKHDTDHLASATRGIYVGGSGDLKVTMIGGEAVTFVGLAAGVIHPIAAIIVWSAGTTATGIVGVY
jgi:hypothetical protein